MVQSIVKYLIYIIVGLIIFDFATTIYAVGYLGAVELNPINGLGFTKFMVLKFFISVMCLVGIIKIETPVKVPCLIILISFYGIIVVNNLNGLICYFFARYTM